jgi:hypothetical protein
MADHHNSWQEGVYDALRIVDHRIAVAKVFDTDAARTHPVVFAVLEDVRVALLAMLGRGSLEAPNQAALMYQEIHQETYLTVLALDDYEARQRALAPPTARVKCLGLASEHGYDDGRKHALVWHVYREPVVR